MRMIYQNNTMERFVVYGLGRMSGQDQEAQRIVLDVKEEKKEKSDFSSILDKEMQELARFA